MIIEKTAWIHPNSLLQDYVVLPDGYQMRRRDAEAQGYTVTSWPVFERAAVAHPHEPDAVILARGVAVSADTAKEAGFKLVTQVSADPNRSWRAAIMVLPETKERSSATAELLTTQSPETLSVEAARAFLRGLPTEHDEQTEEHAVTDKIDPRAARMAEIQASMATFNKSQGYSTPSRAAVRPVQERTDIEPAKLQRLVEIRLTGLSLSGRENTEEAKILRNSLDTFHRVGTPIHRALAQHGFDAATLIRASH